MEGYKAVPFKVNKYSQDSLEDSLPWERDLLENNEETRYCIVSVDTGEIVDDAQGYGYKSAQKAYRGFSYKHRDKSKDSERLAKEKHIEEWIQEHKSFMRLLECYEFDIVKGAMAPGDKVDAKFVRDLLKEQDLEIDFTARDLLNTWSNYKGRI